jgi:signal transduction histidine kinase
MAIPSPPASPAPSPTKRLPSQTTIRTVLFVGFGTILALSVGVGIVVEVGFDRIEREIDRGTQAFIETERDVATVRDCVLEAGIYLRDMLLSTEPDTDAFYLAEVRRSQAASAEAFARINGRGVHVGSTDIEEYEREVQAYWEEIEPVLSLAQTKTTTDPIRVLRERLVAKRELLLQIAAQLQHTSQTRFQAQQRGVAGLRASLQRRIWLVAVASLLLLLAVAVVVTVYSDRLERRLREQLARNAQSSRDLHRLSAQLVGAQEAERRIISRELHDEVGQALTAVKMHLGAVLRATGPGQREEVDQARSITDNALQSVRQLARLLRPPMLDDIGLPATLRWYLDGFSDRSGIETECECGDDFERPAAEVEVCLYRIVQEATTNVARHAGATRCKVTLERVQGSTVLTVQDDGRGFDPEREGHEPGSGVGILGIRERVSGLQGVFALESGPGRGTHLRVEIPHLLTPMPSEADVEVRVNEGVETRNETPGVDRDVAHPAG